MGLSCNATAELQLNAKKVSREGKRNKKIRGKVISAASLSHICSSGKRKERGGDGECTYVGM